MYDISISERTLHFKQPAGTSRGVYTTRHSYYLTVTHPSYPGISGTGECATLPDLSCDSKPEYAQTLQEVCRMVSQMERIPYDMLRAYPSITFGLETAFAEFYSKVAGRQTSHIAHDIPAWAKPLADLYNTSFAQGKTGITINGLVWMGNYDEMYTRLEEKLKAGYHCVKLKIGAINFTQELELIKHIRQDFCKEQVELRVDANGAFAPEHAMSRLEALAQYDIHSIEQPIRQHQWPKMAELCRTSPIPIALDEELIGVNIASMKQALLDTIRPHYIILKPSLHGGMYGCREWISLAEERGIGSWVTSALESNIGLNAVALFCAAMYGPETNMPQGLGTGQLFTDNIPMPLQIRGDKLYRTPFQ